MDQLLTVSLLLGVTVVLARGLRRSGGSAGISVNWDESRTQWQEAPDGKALRAGKSLIILALLFATAGAFALATAHAPAQATNATHLVGTAPDCVNWNGCPKSGVQGVPVGDATDCVNWNGCPKTGMQGVPVGDATDCVNWNGCPKTGMQGPVGAAPACVNWNGCPVDGVQGVPVGDTTDCVNWNGCPKNAG